MSFSQMRLTEAGRRASPGMEDVEMSDEASNEELDEPNELDVEDLEASDEDADRIAGGKAPEPEH